MADITTTTEAEGERMSELIRRAVVRKEDQIQRALQVLQGAQRYNLHYHVLGIDMRPDNSGNWIPIDDVVRVIQILQEGQQ